MPRPTSTQPARPRTDTAGDLPASLAEARTQIRDLSQQLADLSDRHNAVLTGIRQELHTLVGFRWVRPADADKILAKFGLPRLPRRFVVGATVPVTVLVCAPDRYHAERGAVRLIRDDVRRLRDATLRAYPKRDMYDPDGDTVRIDHANTPDPDRSGKRPRFDVHAIVRLALIVDSTRANTVWPAARHRLLADLARLRLTHPNLREVAKSWVYEVGPSCLHPH